jgi:hypothetical protein
MADLSSIAPPNPIWLAVKKQKVWITSAILLLIVALVSASQAEDSLGFVVQSLMKTGPYLLLSIGIAAWAVATGADNLIARAFTGSPALMIFLAALAGGL